MALLTDHDHVISSVTSLSMVLLYSPSLLFLLALIIRGGGQAASESRDPRGGTQIRSYLLVIHHGFFIITRVSLSPPQLVY